MKSIVLMFFILASSCVNRESLKEKEKSDLISKSLISFYNSNETEVLYKTYSQLEKKYKNEELLLKFDKKEVINMFLILKKYSELKHILNTQKKLSYHDKLILNLIDYKIDKENGMMNNKYINNNIRLIQDTLRKSPKDSILYIDYFSMRSVLVDSMKIREEIDSMQYTNKNFSKDFYDLILKNAIYEFQNNPINHDILNKD